MEVEQKKIITKMPDDPRLKNIKRLSKLMDEQFSIGGFKFGLDPILNLIPFAGDISGYAVSLVLIATMVQHGASGRLAAKMIWNATLDALIGAIPFLGWVFDFTYKANTKNVKLLTEHYVEGKHQGSAKPIIISIVVTMLFLLLVVAYVSFKMLQWLVNLIDQSLGVTF